MNIEDLKRKRKFQRQSELSVAEFLDEWEKHSGKSRAFGAELVGMFYETGEVERLEGLPIGFSWIGKNEPPWVPWQSTGGDWPDKSSILECIEAAGNPDIDTDDFEYDSDCIVAGLFFERSRFIEFLRQNEDVKVPDFLLSETRPENARPNAKMASEASHPSVAHKLSDGIEVESNAEATVAINYQNMTDDEVLETGTPFLPGQTTTERNAIIREDGYLLAKARCSRVGATVPLKRVIDKALYESRKYQAQRIGSSVIEVQTRKWTPPSTSSRK